MGADELDVIEICLEIEAKLNLDIPEEVCESFKLVFNIINYVEQSISYRVPKQETSLTSPSISTTINSMKFTDSQVIQRTFHVTTKEMLATYLDYIKDAVWDDANVTDKANMAKEVITALHSENQSEITTLFRDGATVLLISNFDDRGVDYVKIEITKRDGTILVINHEDIEW